MFYGVSYYPEHKTGDELENDLKLIIDSGINTVRMGEFAWCRFEPKDGVFVFSWLDEVIDRLGRAGVKTILCTPTACPPAWMIGKNPEILYMDNRRIRRPFGGRRHYCYNNETYRSYSKRIAEKIAERYGENEFVAGFQIDNEPAQEGTGRCCCPVCTEKFQTRLEEKFKTIEEFNRRSGAIFWSQEYTDFSQIQPPVNSIEPGAQQLINAYYENPTIRLLFERFSSDSQIEYQDIQTTAIKEFSSHPVTTNATGLATNSIDYYKSFKNLDNYAFDYYPGLRDAVVDSFPYAHARGVKNGKAFWILEFMSGGGHRLSGSGRLSPNPNALLQSVVHSLAHGAEMMLHFQFRSYPIGAEQLNYAIVDIDGIPRRRYFEMKKTAETLLKLSPFEKAEFRNEAAVCMSYDSHWALRIKPANDPIFNYIDYCGDFYRRLTNLGVNADVISYDQDFEKYKLLVLPAAFVLSEDMRGKLKNYVKNGGVLVSTFLTSVKNVDNIGYTESLPAGLTDLLGITVEEVEPVFERNKLKVELRLKGGEEVLTGLDGMWSELVFSEAETLGKYTEDYKKGHATITKNSYGKGFAYYLGTDTSDMKDRLLAEICKTHGLFTNNVFGSEKIEVIRRTLNSKNLYYVFNFSGSDAEVRIHGKMKNALSREIVKDYTMIERNGFSVLSEE